MVAAKKGFEGDREKGKGLEKRKEGHQFPNPPHATD
jgi:hypothetical protein